MLARGWTCRGRPSSWNDDYFAIGFSWVSGDGISPNPSSWIPTDGFDKDSVATKLLAGVAAEIVKLGNYDIGAARSDIKAWRELECGSSEEHYINQAIKILNERDHSLVRVYNKLMEERESFSQTICGQRQHEEAGTFDTGGVRISS